MENNLPQRRSIRLQGYDYAQEGAYFITICAHNRRCLFGEIIDDQIRPNLFGQIVQTEWEKTPIIRDNVEIDVFVVMPNHFHGIITLKDTRAVGARRSAPENFEPRKFGPPTKNSLSTILNLFKATVTRQINQSRKIQGVPVWQRGFYEHIVHSEKELNQIREYILFNPAGWGKDRFFMRD